MTDTNMNWTVEDSEYISNHIYFTARRDRCRLPDGQIVPEYFVVELPPSVCAIPITAEGEVVMIRQYRHPLRQTLLEIPGGFVDPLEDPAEAMKRELLEETGYAFDQVTALGRTAANPGLLDNFTSLYLATGGRKVQAQDLDANEAIDIVLMPLEVLEGMLRRHELVQSMHTCCLFYALLHMGRLQFT
jgi:ADP-ribose pyrophosphatase